MSSLDAPQGGARQPVNIEDEMRGSYLAYAMSVIIGRALPDVRDGLKPVHRRVLYTMHEQRNTFGQPHKKSARIVGDVMGKYHPHGDQAIYDTLVRLAQDFSLRDPLVDGQGNFGSIDGDRAAAMRYTEVRMTRLTEELLRDIDKATVDWQENYDGREMEPVVLPAGFPNLLVNGSGGIAVGMSTNIPPHNLGEVIDATQAIIERPDIEIQELCEIVKGPDFPTAGIIYGQQGIWSAYTTGRGIVRIRAQADFEQDSKGDDVAIVVTELPYQVNKAKLLERIAGLVRDKRIEGIRDLRDESDRKGMRVYIELKRGAIAQVVLNKLFAMTPMQSSFGIINLAIVEGQPRVLTLKEMLGHFINHRRDVVTRRCRYELARAQERAHILKGYLLGLENIDEVVELIKTSPTPHEARTRLGERFGLTEIQAQAILDMRLQRLTGLEVDKIKAEYADIQETIARLTAILGSDELLMEVIANELTAIRERFASPRRTRIVEASGEISMEDLIADDEMVVTVTTGGYVKRTPLAEYRTQRRGGRGRSGMSTKTEDVVHDVFVATAHQRLLIFTDRGQVYPLKVWQIPKSGINSTGRAIVNLLPLGSDEQIRAILAPGELDRDDVTLVFATRKGVVKRTVLSQYKNLRTNGLIAIRLRDGDDLVNVRMADDDHFVMMATAHGQSIIFSVHDARPKGRATMGVRGIRLMAGDEVVAMSVVRIEGVEVEPPPADELATDEADDLDELEVGADEVEDEEEEDDDAGEEGVEEELDPTADAVLLITQRGYGKRTALAKFRVQNRGGKGLRALPWLERNGDLVDMCLAHGDQDLMVVTDGGTIIRMPMEQISVYSRSARGVRIINLSEEERVMSVRPVEASEEEDEGESAEGADGAEASAEDGEGSEAAALTTEGPSEDDPEVPSEEA